MIVYEKKILKIMLVIRGIHSWYFYVLDFTHKTIIKHNFTFYFHGGIVT